jgi:hypothetical protein
LCLASNVNAASYSRVIAEDIPISESVSVAVYRLNRVDVSDNLPLSESLLAVFAPSSEDLPISESVSVAVYRASLPPPGGGGGGFGGGDTEPPRISDILASAITETSADIAWEANERSDSQVEYWSSPSKFSPLDTEMVIHHLVHLTGLTPGTTYHYKTMSRDRAGNLAVSPEYTFTTLGKPPAPAAPPAAFECSLLTISPTEVDIDETVSVTILVANTGGQSGSYQVVLRINGVVAADREVALDAGASEQVSFSIAWDTAGIYLVDVNGLTGAFVVKEKAVSPVTPVEPTPAKPINWWLIGGIIAAVVVMGLLIFFLARRKA